MSVHEILFSVLQGDSLGVDEGGRFIRELLRTRRSMMVARFGSVEIKGVLYPHIPWPLRNLARKRVFSSMQNNAGFFSISEDSVKDFSKLMLEDIQCLDVLGSWRAEEIVLCKSLKGVVKVQLDALEPYYSAYPWTEELAGRKVLVVHPFNKTIEHQYFDSRQNIFADKRILPEFKNFQTLKAVQTIAGNRVEFDSWFSALDSMKAAINEIDFDVAIIGCGAYGFPLAAHVKRMGKQAVHLGGATQILFGIKGKRWDNNPTISKMYNRYWVRPAPEDIPINNGMVEDGCYW